MTDEDPMAASRAAYSRRARAARIEQGLPRAIEDADALAYLADVLSAPSGSGGSPDRRPRTTTAS
jgi:hypothetical protein